jgi:TetR/AcrR family transcriptional regulator, cholesterol catabolism regulator
MASARPLVCNQRMPDRVQATTDYQAAIIEAAAGLFARQGYRGTSMRDIGAAIGIHAGSLYVHIESKEDLLHQIVNSIMLQSEQDMAEVLAQGGTPTAQLHEIALRDLRLIGENRERATVFFHEWRNLSPQRQEAVIASRDRWEDGLRSVLRRGIELGEFRAVDVRITGIALTSMLNWAYVWYSPGGELSVEQLADQYVDLLVAGLRPR